MKLSKWRNAPADPNEPIDRVEGGIGITSPAPPVDQAAVDAAKSVTIEATIIRADGTRQVIGAVSKRYRNPLKNAAWRMFGKPLSTHRIRKFNKSARS